MKTGLNPRRNFKLNELGSDLPYITGKDIKDEKINVTKDTDLINRTIVDLINKRANLEVGNLLFASTGTGTVGRTALITDYQNDWNISETLYSLKPNQNIILPEFLQILLESKQSKNQYSPKISKGSVPHLKIVDLLKVKISLPNLERQQKIINILNNFKDLIFILKKEIELRQKQYEYYRDKLLDFGESDE